MSWNLNSALYVVPARGGSVGLHRKALCQVCGHPLIYYTLEFLRRVVPDGNIVVVTDDDEIEAVSLEHGVRVVREPHVPPESGNTVRAVRFAVRQLEEQGLNWPLVAIAQPTQPVRTLGQLNQSIAMLNAAIDGNREVDACLTVIPVDSPGLQLLRDDNGLLKSWLLSPGTRQEMAPVFRVSGNYFVLKTDTFMTMSNDPKSLYQNLNWVTYEHPAFPWVDIDTEQDRHLFEMILKAGYWSMDAAIEN